LLSLLVLFAECKEDGRESLDVENVRVGDINVAYKVMGTGYPLILITGYSATMDLWPPEFLKNLSNQFEVIVFDNRGMGLTDAPAGNFSIEQLADDTAGLMDALEIEQAHVLGWSLGGSIAQELALEHPEKVNKLVLYASDFGVSKSVPPSSEVLAEMLNASGSEEERGMRLIGLMFPQQWLTNHPDIMQWFPMPTEHPDPANIQRQAEAYADWKGSWDRLHLINCSTLVVTGTEDLMAPPENAAMLASQIPGSWLARFEGAGHGLMYQYPDELAEIIKDFLNLRLPQ
jgi:pimeloyl-ACP methyl ester carboxylesterase